MTSLLLRMLAEANTTDHHHDEEDEFAEMHEDEHHEGDDDKPWGDVIAASLLIQIVTVTGLFFTVAVGYYGKMRGSNQSKLMHTMSFKIIPSFACGALLATAVFLVIPEALTLIGGGHDDAHGAEEAEVHHDEGEEHNHTERFLMRFLEEEEAHEEEHEEHNKAEASWKFGAALLSGFMFPILLHVFFPVREQILEEDEQQLANDKSSSPDAVQEDVDEDQSDKSRDTAQVTEHSDETKSIDWTLACSILVGDFFHNFTDGVFVGTAFLLCSRDVAYTIVATTIYHEIAQEIADFALLHHHCGLAAWKAVVYNFISGFSVMIGALMILSFDMTDVAKGVTLSIAAGIYIYIAACECVPRIQAVRKGPKDTLLFLIFFVLGVVPIGLVLLNHQHCEASHGDHEGEEHHEEEQHEGEARLLF